MKEKQIIDAYCHIRTIDQSIPDDVLDFMKQSSLKLIRNSANKMTLQECKEKWAANYGKTWADVQRDFEYSMGVSKEFDFEKVMDMVAEIYKNQQ